MTGCVELVTGDCLHALRLAVGIAVRIQTGALDAETGTLGAQRPIVFTENTRNHPWVQVKNLKFCVDLVEVT